MDLEAVRHSLPEFLIRFSLSRQTPLVSIFNRHDNTKKQDRFMNTNIFFVLVKRPFFGSVGVLKNDWQKKVQRSSAAQPSPLSSAFPSVSAFSVCRQGFVLD